MKRKRKGQAALEFLMTYGWAFLVILIVIGAFVYFDVLNPAGLVPARCSFPAGFSCSEFGVSESNGVQFVMVNRQGYSVQIENVTVTTSATSDPLEIQCDGTTTDTNDPVTSGDRIIEGRHLLYECEFTSGTEYVAGERFQGDIIVKFRRAGGLIDQQATGSIGATVTE